VNEQPNPDHLADRLVDGTATADQVPADLRSVSELLQSAHGPATAAELSGMASMVQQFTATVLDPTLTPATTTSRRPRMFATRITRRAAAVVAVTLMAAGTAAAAAGGALPDVFSTDDPSIAAETSLVDTTLDDDSDDATDDATETTDVDVTDDSVLDSLGPDAAGEAAHGLCESYERGNNDDRGSDNRNDRADDNPSNTNPPTLNLEQAAADAGVTVDEYCTAVLAAHEAEDEADEEGDDSTESTIDEDDSNSGSGNRPTITTPDRSGSNSGRGGNSDSDDSDDESAG